MIKMTTIRPPPPLGPYPQFRLCDHVGSAPSNNKIKITSGSVVSFA